MDLFFKLFDIISSDLSGPFWNCIANEEVIGCTAKFHSLTSSVAICIAFAGYSFIWSLLGRNCSKVDQIWSITPVVYAWHFFFVDRLKNPDSPIHQRLLLLCVLITLWGIRLTFNFWRRGGYGNLITHEEDYRWPILRQKMNPFVFWIVFNITFIASYQNLLLWLIVTPLFQVGEYTSRTLVSRDFSMAAVFVTLLVMETVADQQQWDFQSFKYSLSPEERLKHPRKDIREGFLQSGLYRYSRHPNYFAEQAMWVVVYLFSMSTNAALNWTLSGCTLLILLFHGSVAFSESITEAKYPAYKEFRKTTSCLIPFYKSAPAKSVSKSE